MKKPLIVPEFKNDDEEFEFWSEIDFGDYLEAKDLQPVSFPNLKPTTTAVSIRIPEYLLVEIKTEANKLAIPYQSLIKQYIQKGLMRDKAMHHHVYGAKKQNTSKER